MEKNLPLWLACAAVYFSAAFAKQPPAIVPATLHLPVDVKPDPSEHFKYPDDLRIAAGEHAVSANRWGALFAIATDGREMGIKPGEYRVLTWRTANASDPLTLEFCLKALGLEAHQFQVHRQVNVTGEPHETAASLWDAFSPIIYGVLQTFENRQQRIATFSYFLAAIGGSMCAEFGKETALRMLVALEQGILAIEEAEVH